MIKPFNVVFDLNSKMQPFPKRPKHYYYIIFNPNVSQFQNDELSYIQAIWHPNWPQFPKWRRLTHNQAKMTKNCQNISFHDFQPRYTLIFEKKVDKI